MDAAGIENIYWLWVEKRQRGEKQGEREIGNETEIVEKLEMRGGRRWKPIYRRKKRGL